MTEMGRITGYHAHVYYDPETRETAARIREGLDERFDVRLGRWHDKPIGPHPQSMYQVAFDPDQLAGIVPWLMLGRDGLTVLVHPNTGDDVPDHSDHAIWLGPQLTLDLSVLNSEDI